MMPGAFLPEGLLDALTSFALPFGEEDVWSFSVSKSSSPYWGTLLLLTVSSAADILWCDQTKCNASLSAFYKHFSTVSSSLLMFMVLALYPKTFRLLFRVP